MTETNRIEYIQELNLDVDIEKDLGMVEQLGSGVPRILQAYNKDCFKFSENYLRMTFPASEKHSMQATMQVTMQVTPQVTPQVEELIKIITGEHTRQYLQDKLNNEKTSRGTILVKKNI